MGTYNEMSGAQKVTDCKPAPAGNFAEGTGNDGFTPCLAGTFQDKTGQGSCKVGGGARLGGRGMQCVKRQKQICASRSAQVDQPLCHPS